MQAHSPQQTLAPGASHAEEGHVEVSHFLYQGATVIAILLFLISLWSC